MAKTLRQWLQPVIAEGLAVVEDTTVALEDLGTYEAPALKIIAPDQRIVWIKPAGALAVGARGWVEVSCRAARALLVLNRMGQWKVRGPRADGLDVLDEARFAELLAELFAWG
jgi:hypothetical protein